MSQLDKASKWIDKRFPKGARVRALVIDGPAEAVNTYQPGTVTGASLGWTGFEVESSRLYVQADAGFDFESELSYASRI